MNINDLVTHYVEFRRTLGQKFNTTENILRSFCRATGPHTSVGRIRRKVVDKFLSSAGSATRTWHFKYRILKGLFQFAVSRGYMDLAPLPAERPKCHSTFVPYIYSRAELRRLLEAIPSYHRFPSRIEPSTLRAILLLLYGAGLRRGEALRLTLADGRELSAPVEWFPRLRDATPDQRRDWRLIGGGEGVHWPQIDEDIAVRTLLRMA